MGTFTLAKKVYTGQNTLHIFESHTLTKAAVIW